MKEEIILNRYKALFIIVLYIIYAPLLYGQNYEVFIEVNTYLLYLPQLSQNVSPQYE